MTNGGGGWTAGRIILLVVGILVGLGVICCGAAWFLVGDKVKSGMRFAADMAAFEEKIKAEFGREAVAVPHQSGQMDFVLLVGVAETPTPERVVEIQDKAWRIFAEQFRENGFFTVEEVGVGTSARKGGRGPARVVDWRKNTVSVEEIVKRTGVEAPPLVKFLPSDLGGDVRITVQTDEDEEPADTEKKDEGDGGDSGGK